MNSSLNEALKRWTYFLKFWARFPHLSQYPFIQDFLFIEIFKISSPSRMLQRKHSIFLGQALRLHKGYLIPIVHADRKVETEYKTKTVIGGIFLAPTVVTGFFVIASAFFFRDDQSIREKKSYYMTFITAQNTLKKFLTYVQTPFSRPGGQILLSRIMS